MKKKLIGGRNGIPKILLRKIFMIMKLANLLLLVTVLNVFGSKTYSQNTRLNLEMKDVSIREVLAAIEGQSEFFFLYSSKMIDVSRKVDVRSEGNYIDEVLDKLLANTDIKYSVRDRQVLLMNKGTGLDLSLQQQFITGTVFDSQTGEPMVGVNVIAKGTTLGTITDINGKFSISVSDRNAILIFSFIGYVAQEIPLNGRSALDVELAGELKGLDEVVVIGYGVQRKVNVLGSISTINPEELTVNPMPTIAQSLMGKMPGVYIKNVNAQPGDETSLSFNIRGFGTPLIIIDGATSSERDFQKLNPNDIENLSILKDAAAASIYGARAGNGVVLVTTKRGQVSAPTFKYNSNLELQYFLAIPEWVNSEQRARLENIGFWNEGLTPKWTDEQIQKFHDGSDPDKYPDTDWYDLTVRKFAPQLQQNLSVQGGTERVRYYISGGYFYQEAMLKANDTKNKRYNIRSNIDINLTSKLSMNLDISVLKVDYLGPLHEMERTTTYSGIMTTLFRADSYTNVYYPDRTKLPSIDHPYNLSTIENNGYKDKNQLNGNANIGFSYNLPLNIQAKANFRFYDARSHEKEVVRKVPKYLYDWDTDVYTLAGYTHNDSKVYQYTSNSFNFEQQYFLNWSQKFGNHNISALAGYEVLSDYSEWFEASRMRYAFSIDYLFAGPSLDQNNSGKGSEGYRTGVISRLNYDYKGKYFVELNSRNDASSKFPKETRWGFFPSASIGWRISEEAFIKDNLTYINNLKIRASRGKLGYDATSSFQFLETFSVSGMIIYDGQTDVINDGIKPDALPNPTITWEKMTTTNVGLDFNLWNNLFEGSFDYFYRLRSDVLGTRIQSMPNVVGASLPQVNYAKYDNRGWEFILHHRKTISNINYNIGGNIAWNREKTVYVDQNVFSSDEVYRRDNRIGEWTDTNWGYMIDGLFQTQEEIDNWADIDGKNNSTRLPGDVKFVDYNGDGKITADDQVIMGRGTFPKLMYGLDLSLDWKGINFTMLWQGAGLYDVYMRSAEDYIMPFKADDQPMTIMLNDFYIPEGNPWLPANTNARWPRYRSSEASNRGDPNFANKSQLYLISGGYIRLKNIELGYTLPTDLTKKWGIDMCKFYISGYNVLTFSALDWMDPEIDTNAARTLGDYYPPVGTYNLGLLIQF